jgi:RimJ/RimL family protein N-acetyltransferase
MDSAQEPAPIFVTERLVIRSWTLDDAEGVFAIFSDPAVSRIAGSPPASVAVSRERLNRWLAHYERMGNGLGFWAIVERESGLAVGEVKLQPFGGPLASSPEVELGYYLARQHWGKGYATEAARGALRYGFEQLDLPRIWVLVRSDNDRSLRVVARLGARSEGRQQHDDWELQVFCVDRPSVVRPRRF